MKQYFYLVMYGINKDIPVPGKIFLQESEAIRWGRTLATKNPNYSVYLYRQEIARTSAITFYKHLSSFN